MKTVKEILAEYEDLPEYYGKHLSSVNERGGFGDTPLHTAIWRKSLEEVRTLLNNGADPNAPGEYGNRPLHAAIDCKSEEMIRALICAGAKCDLRNEDGQDAWQVAEVAGYKTALERIVKEASG